MKHVIKRLTRSAALLATASLAACGSGGTSNSSARDDTGANEASASSALAINPFVDAEKQMKDAMMAATGSDPGQTWALKMIAHHQGAIAMSNVVLAHNPSADVAKMARDDIDKQTKDVGSIRKLLQSGAPDPNSAKLFRPAMMDMDQAMMTARGPSLSETYLRKMLAHHKGAVAMSDVALDNGVSGAMKAQVEKTKTENQKDAAMVEAMLSGKPMTMPDDMNGMAMNNM